MFNTVCTIRLYISCFTKGLEVLLNVNGAENP